MPDPKQPVARRGLLIGAGGAGALAAAATLLPKAEPAEPAAAGSAERGANDKSAGYRLTEHIQRYYKTARI